MRYCLCITNTAVRWHVYIEYITVFHDHLFPLQKYPPSSDDRYFAEMVTYLLKTYLQPKPMHVYSKVNPVTFSETYSLESVIVLHS